jgi:hypothetical protein
VTACADSDIIRAMDDASQIHIPESFIRLQTRPGQRPAPLAQHIARRFEVCDDMANALVTRAQEVQFKLGITEPDVIDKVLEGLLELAGEEPDSVLSPPEARWVVCHMAEQLGWTEHLSPELRAMAGGLLQ